MNEEPFGPLALVNPVRNLDEAIEKANSLPYGLAAYAFTRSSNNAHRLANDVEAVAKEFEFVEDFVDDLLRTSDKQRALRSCKPLVILTADSPAGVAVYAGEP